ncbi:hypothetical protein FBEOM_9737 [Fusarium beomiforme]|uniref:5'-3' DNA helicase ZGRF1-like N-terminal domain-containing protein n=1 Tax=Fusarium beomiforme TaxID=44412 RepID=A0A9P5DVK9_9HYPO|nr:hypothetical protein FBEOM_9737 [Fusarium beomiforme]
MTSGSIPTSALVVDYICLFTHDLKRKQKRWQDGVLKYHTFNKRIMVYDDRNHFIGDAHWQEGGDLEPGDEFELDRGAAIVQVSDCTGQREQDLTELLDKRAKEVERRRTNAGPTRTPGSTIAATPTLRNDQNAPHFQLRHLPLNGLVGGASRIGRAVISPHSPYEQRKMAESPGQQQDSPSEDARPSKRRKREESPPSKMGHARALFGTTLTLTPFSSSVPAARSQPLHNRVATRPKATSNTTRDGMPDASRRADRSSKSLPPSSDPEEAETSAPRVAAPRRVLTQRASLRELLAGNEHNRTGELPRLRDTVPKNRANVSKQVRPQLPPPGDEVVSLLTQEPEPAKHRRDTATKSSYQTRNNQEPATDKASKSWPSAPKPPETAGSERGEEEPVGIDDDAFLNWLAQSEGPLSVDEAPAPPRSKKSKSDPVLAVQRPAKESARKVVQEPIVVNEDDDEAEEVLPLPKPAQTRPQALTSKPSKRNMSISEPHGTKRTLSIDRASVTDTDTDKPPPAKEPRTELRIRSRQRRGLLMMAQSKQGSRSGSAGRSLPPSSGAGSDTHAVSHTVARAPSESDETEVSRKNATMTTTLRRTTTWQNSVKPNEPRRPVEEPDDQPIEIFDTTPAEEARDKDSDDASDPLEKPEVEAVPSGDEVSFRNVPEDRESSTPPRRRANPSRRSRKRAAPVFLSDDEGGASPADSPAISEDEEEDLSAGLKAGRKPEPKPSSGPRITKMSRKSIKSREIIGFVMPTENFPIAGFNIGHAGLLEAKRPGFDLTTSKASLEKAQDISRLLENTVVQDDHPGMEQPTTIEKQPAAKQPSTKEKEVEAVLPSNSGKESHTGTNSKEPKAVEQPSIEKEKDKAKEAEAVQSSVTAPEGVQPPTNGKESGTTVSQAGPRELGTEQPFTKEKGFKELQLTTRGKDLQTLQTLTKGKASEAAAPSTSGKRLEAPQPPTNGKEQQEKQRPRIVNPATRGKKAATKQDAAGLPPQNLVQFEPATSTRFVPSRAPKTTTPVSNVPQSELPSFCRANGGAWSRHAEDLLGMTRPTRRKSRR